MKDDVTRLSRALGSRRTDTRWKTRGSNETSKGFTESNKDQADYLRASPGHQIDAPDSIDDGLELCESVSGALRGPDSTALSWSKKCLG